MAFNPMGVIDIAVRKLWLKAEHHVRLLMFPASLHLALPTQAECSGMNSTDITISAWGNYGMADEDLIISQNEGTPKR